MTFQVDKQTLKDIQVFNERKSQLSVFTFYNQIETKGGQELLYEIFKAPSSDIKFLENRKREIKFFFENDCHLKLNSRSVDFIEFYLNSRRVPLKANIIDATVNGLSHKFNPDSDYHIITEGIIHITQLLLSLDSFIEIIKSHQTTATFDSHIKEIKDFRNTRTISNLLANPPEKVKDLTYNQINKLDNHFRIKEKEAFRNLLNVVYEIDFLQSMGLLMKSKGLVLPDYEDDVKLVFKVTDSFHPFLDHPIRNSYEFKENSNLCFLTGPNMSGKSTFLKTMGLLVYLSHIGLPVPAREFKTSVFEGLFTTINISDDLNLGYSHFYAEVNRVKEIVTKLYSNRKLVIIFDELFRGTNVKDAFDASLRIISSLSKIQNNYFFISTHILEVAENLDNADSILFKCFESEIIDKKPVYNFRLKDGISEERVGMIILQKENIFQILDEVIKKQKQSL